MKSKTIKIENKEVVVKELPFIEYAEVIKAIQKLPESLEIFTKLKKDNPFESLPLIAGNALPDLIRIISIYVALPYDEVKTWGIAKVTKALTAIYEVNDLELVFKEIKKALAHQPAIKDFLKKYQEAAKKPIT